MQLLWDYILRTIVPGKKKRMNLKSYYANFGISFVSVCIFINKIIATIVQRNGKE